MAKPATPVDPKVEPKPIAKALETLEWQLKE